MAKQDTATKKSWFDGLKAEFKKIIWPTREDIQKETTAVVVVSIIHGQVRLTELNQEIIDARSELAEKQSVYTQLEMKVDSSVSTTVVENYAKDHLAMNKANNSQKEFVNLSDGDKAEVSMSEDKNIFERIGDALASIWS